MNARLSDFPIIVFWPDPTVYSLPATPREWELRSQVLDPKKCPKIPKNYWGEKPADDTIFLRFQQELLTRCMEEMRDVLANISSGYLAFVVVPDEFPEWNVPLAKQAFRWFAAGLDAVKSESETIYISPLDQKLATHSSHQLIHKMQQIDRILESPYPLALQHIVDYPRRCPEDFGPCYASRTWHELLWGLAVGLGEPPPGSRERTRWLEESRKSPWLSESVDIVPTHRNLPSHHGRVKAMAFVCGSGGIGVIPEPSSLGGLLDWLSPMAEKVGGYLSHEAVLRRELLDLAGPNLNKVDLSSTCLRSLTFVIKAAASTRSRAEFYQLFVDKDTGKLFHRDVVRKQLLDRLISRGVPGGFIERIRKVIKDKPTR